MSKAVVLHPDLALNVIVNMPPKMFIAQKQKDLTNSKMQND